MVTDPRFHGLPSAAGRFELILQVIDAAKRKGTRRITAQVFAPVVAPAGLIGWWRADGNAQDITGNHPGTLSKGVGFGDGVFELAFEFDGVSGRVEIPDPAVELRPSALTIEAWVFLDTIEATMPLSGNPWALSKTLPSRSDVSRGSC